MSDPTRIEQLLTEILRKLEGYVPKGYITFEEACHYLSVKEGTLREWMRLKKLPLPQAGERGAVQDRRPGPLDVEISL